MKKIKSTLLLSMFIGIFSNTIGQTIINPTISVLPSNSGIVEVDKVIDIIVTIGNTGNSNVPAFKLRPNMTIPASVVFLPNADQLGGLPPNWSIVSNTGQQLRICNGTDAIGPTVNRIITLKVKGVTITAAQTFNGQFGFGGASCAASGGAPSLNTSSDDNGTSTIEVIAAALPIKISEFKVSVNNCKPILNWSTVSEINSDRFDIESSNSINDWKTIGTVAATGNGANIVNYSFSDVNSETTKEKKYYRLKMFDKDGTFEYSDVITAIINCNTAVANVYPNPVHDNNLYVNITSAEFASSATLISSTGQEILKTKLISGLNTINVSSIANGIYILKINDSKGLIKTSKVSINH